MVASSFSYSALAAILPMLPCEFLEQQGRREGENEILPLFLKCFYWGATTPPIWKPRQVQQLLSIFLWQWYGIPHWTLWFTWENCVTGVLWRCWTARELAGSGQCLCTEASCSLCFWLLCGQERKRCRGQALRFRSCKFAGVLKVLTFDLFSLRLRICWKSSFKNVHLEEAFSSLKLKIYSFRKYFLPEMCNVT